MFKIVEESKPFVPEIKALPDFNLVGFENEINLNKPVVSHLIFIEIEPWGNDISPHIDWGEITDSNGLEQGGILIGTVFFDKEKEITYGIIKKAIPGYSAVGSPSYLEMNHNTWKEMLDSSDEYIEANEQELVIIGWYHTHPRGLPVFMSGTDKKTQKTFFSKNWQFALVLNPNKKIIKAFYGAEAIECQCFLISTFPEGNNSNLKSKDEILGMDSDEMNL